MRTKTPNHPVAIRHYREISRWSVGGVIFVIFRRYGRQFRGRAGPSVIPSLFSFTPLQGVYGLGEHI